MPRVTQHSFSRNHNKLHHGDTEAPDLLISTNPQADRVVAKLLEKLNTLQCVYPGAELTLYFTLVSS